MLGDTLPRQTERGRGEGEGGRDVGGAFKNSPFTIGTFLTELVEPEPGSSHCSLTSLVVCVCVSVCVRVCVCEVGLMELLCVSAWMS